jgi:plasmid stability protein
MAYIAGMPTLTIRNIDDSLRLKLRARAAANGRSMEAELRAIIAMAADAEPPPRNVGRSIQARFAKIGGVELELPERTAVRTLPKF